MLTVTFKKNNNEENNNHEIYYFKGGGLHKYDKKEGSLENILTKKCKPTKNKNQHHTLEDFDNIEVTMENEYIFQDLLYSRYGDPSNPNTKLYDGDDKYWK